MNEQKIRARLIFAHANSKNGNQIAYKDELVLYDFAKPLDNNENYKEIRLRLGDGENEIKKLSSLVLDNMNFYDSKPEKPEVGDVWYDEESESFYIGEGSIYEKVEITEENYESDIYYYWSEVENKYEYDNDKKWIKDRQYYKLIRSNSFIKLSHIIDNIEDGAGEGSIQTTDKSNAIGKYSSALGYDTQAGSMCFKFDSSKNHTVDKFYLLNTDNKTFEVANKKFSMKLDNNFDYAGVATSLENGILTVQTLTATHNGAPAVPGTEGVGALAIDGDSFLFFPGYPELGTDILGEGAIALGINNKAQSNASFAEGKDTVSAGQYAHAEGRRTNAIGYAAHAEGIDTKAIGQRSHAEGDNAIAEGYGAHAQGQKTEAIGKQSHAEGVESIAKGDQSHAEGLNTYTQGQGAHSEGIRTAAIGPGAHAEGKAVTEPLGADGKLQSWNKNAGLSIAEGEASHIEGIHTHTGPDAHAAHAEGELTEAKGASAHAEGKETQAIGEASHAEGIGTIANGIGQHVQGKYNEVDENDDYAHIIGNGNNHHERSNAYTLDWEGNAWFAGNIETKNIKAEKVEATNGEFAQASIVNGTIEALAVTGGAEINGNLNIVGNIEASEHTISVNNIYANNINANNDIIGNQIISEQNIISNNGVGYFAKGISVANNKWNITEKGDSKVNSLIIGDESIVGKYGQAMRYRGKVKTTTDVIDAKNGDLVISEIDPEQKTQFLGFYIPAADGNANITDDFEITTSGENGRIICTGGRNNLYIKALMYLTNCQEYIDNIPADLNEIRNFGANVPFADNLFINFSFDTGRLLQFNLATIIIQGRGINGIDTVQFDGYWITKPDSIYLDFPNNLSVLMYTSPSKDSIDVSNHPEMEEYKKLQSNSENVYIYSETKWVKLNSSTIGGGTNGNGLLPFVGYQEFCKYRITEENSIIDCLNQAVSENSTVYIFNGNYMTDEAWEVPDIDNLHFIGVDDVILDFKIRPRAYAYNETIQQNWIWENIIFNKEVTLSVLSLSGDTNYQRKAKILNCQFNNKIDVCDDLGTQNYFENCIFNDNINNSENYGTYDSDLNIEYINCIFNINKWSTDINKILASKIEYCTFYFPIEQKDVVFGRAFTNNGGFNSSNLFTNNTYYLMGDKTKFFIPEPIWIENLMIENSIFPWNPVLEPEAGSDEEGHACRINRETCYINSGSAVANNDILIQDKESNIIYNQTAEEKNIIQFYKEEESSSPSLLLVDGAESTPDGDEFDLLEKWKISQEFSYINSNEGSLIQGQNHFVYGGSNTVTGRSHLVTGVNQVVEGSGNVIGGFDNDGVIDIMQRGNHAEGVSNSLIRNKNSEEVLLLGRHIEGVGNIGNSLSGSHTQGKYNIQDTEDKYLHIVGNGRDKENRSNAHTIDKNGNAWFQGGLTLTNENYPVIHYRETNSVFPQHNLAAGQMFNLTKFSVIPQEEMTLTLNDKIVNNVLQIDNLVIKNYLLNSFNYLFGTEEFKNYHTLFITPTFKLQTSSEILEFKNISNINNDDSLLNITFADLVITNLNGDEITTENYNPDDQGNIYLDGKKVKILGVYNSLNERYEAGLYLRTNDNNDWTKLSVFNSENQGSSNPSTGGGNAQNRLLIIKPLNGKYKFNVDLSDYGIKYGDIINYVCVGAGGAGGGISSTKKGGDAGVNGYSTSSSNGGASGTGFGAGGGGSCANSTSSSYYGGSGGGSGYVSMGNSHKVTELIVEVTLGKGGTGGSGVGGDGGSTSFLGTTAAGGEGGKKGGTSRVAGGIGGNYGDSSSSGNVSKSGGNGGNGWVPSNYNPNTETISIYGAISSDDVPTYSGDGAIFIWY